MKIMVTGGAGFIGSHVTDAYIQAGHDVAVVDNLATGSRDNLNAQASFHHVDVCSPELDQVFVLEKPDLVNHHAAQISVPLSIEDPLRDAEINLKGLINLLQCCVKHQVKKVIFISSGGAIYGEAEEYPTSESYRPEPLSVYAINKFAGELYLRFYQHQYGLNYSILRYANVYGPRQASHTEAGVVSLFIETLLQGKTPAIFSYPEEPDGMIRDYVFVGDVVRANLSVLQDGNNDVFNIGTGVETTTAHLYRAISWQLGTRIQPLRAPARKGDLRRSLLDCSKAFNQLGWSPIYTLEAGVRETAQFFSSKRGIR